MTKKKKLESAILASWTISLVATLGSLFLSEIMEFIPCKLCWFQRIAMYPQVILLGITFLKKDFKYITQIIPFTVIGLLVALYHYLIQNMPFVFKDSTFCGRIPCNPEYINLFGFITIPFLSFLSFLSLFLIQSWVLLIIKSKGRQNT